MITKTKKALVGEPEKATGSEIETKTYRSAVVTFIDVLGFRELVRSRPAEEIRNIVRLMQQFAAANDADFVEQAKLKDEISWTRTVAFSDSIVRIRPFDGPYSDGSLFYEILDLVHAQADLANRGVIIRGGMTVGSVYFDDDVAFGPAFVRAYDLESQYANVPRIVIGPEVFTELRKNPQLRAEHHDLQDEIRHLKKLVRRGEDGFWFVDYFKAIAAEMDEPDVQYPIFAEVHRDLITGNAGNIPANGRALQKYLWLAAYHNVVCREWGDQADKFQITSADISALETLPES